MGVPSRIESDVYINGSLSAKTMSIPSGTVNNDDVASDAAIVTTKLIQRHSKTYAEDVAVTATAKNVPIHVVRGATGTLVAFEAGSAVVCDENATITVDLKKNSSTNSLLSAAIVLDHDNTAYTVEAGTIATAGLVDGDVVRAVIAVAAGTGTVGLGVFTNVLLDEDPE